MWIGSWCETAPALPYTRFLDGSPLEKTLHSHGAAFLNLPALLADTRNHLRAHEARLGRGLSPAEALKNSELQLDLVHLLVLEDWLGETFRQFDAIAGHLLPPPLPRQRRSSRRRRRL